MEDDNNLNTVENSNQTKQESAEEIVPIKKVAISYFGGYLLALIIVWVISGFNPEMIVYIHWFPRCIFPFMMFNECGYVAALFVGFVGYAIYLSLFTCAFIWRKKKIFIRLLIIYILILCLNISGCAIILNINPW